MRLYAHILVLNSVTIVLWHLNHKQRWRNLKYLQPKINWNIAIRSFQRTNRAQVTLHYQQSSQGFFYLAKFGYIPGMKVFFKKSLKIFAYMLEPNREIWQFLLKRNLIVKIWWLEKPNYFFSHFGKKTQLCEFSQKTKTLRVVDIQFYAKTLANGELGWGRHGVAM
jgi:hypothetical protein